MLAVRSHARRPLPRSPRAAYVDQSVAQTAQLPTQGVTHAQMLHCPQRAEAAG
jgi:hypothetical protein